MSPQVDAIILLAVTFLGPTVILTVIIFAWLSLPDTRTRTTTITRRNPSDD